MRRRLRRGKQASGVIVRVCDKGAVVGWYAVGRNGRPDLKAPVEYDRSSGCWRYI